MKILIIEDEIGISNHMRLSLESNFGLADQAHNGQQGLDLIKKHSYDLIILDNQLPKLSGKEVCIAAREAGVSCPILAISVLDSTQTKVEFLHAGADDYLIKPFAFEELLARAHALLRRPVSILSDVLRAGDIRLLIKQHRCYCGDALIRLTRKEFMLLEYFMRNRSIVLSRQLLLQHVWDTNTDPFTYTVESHIASLRKKIGDADRTIIKTISGVGYQLDA